MTTTNTVCTLCGATMAEAAYLCVRCADNTRDALNDLADSWQWVEHATSGMARKGRIAGTTSGHGDGIPIGALSVALATENAIGTWLRELVEDRRLPDAPQARDVASVARHLAGHLNAVRMAPQAAGFALDAMGAAKAVVMLVQPPEAAPETGRRILDHETELIECWTTIPRAAEVVIHLRTRPPSEATIRSWAGQTGRRPLLLLQGGLVRVGSVLELADTRHARRVGT